jgi:hypothetical protein
MRIPSGVTDQYIYFVAVDSTDFTTRETGLSSFTVYRSRDGGVAAAFTTPTINETDATNMPGVYELLLDEDMTIGTGNDSEEMVFHITHAGMAPVTRTIELYRSKITAGNTLTVSAGGSSNSIVQSTAANAITATSLATGAITSAKFAASAINAAAIATDAITAAKIAADAIGASELAADAVTEIGTGVWASATRTVTAATNITSTGGTTVPQTGDSFARIGANGAGLTTLATAANLATVDTVVDGIQTDLDNATDGLGAIKTETALILADTNELQTDWVDGGRLDNLLDSASSAGDPWATSLPGAYGAGTAGNIIGNNIDAPLSTIDTVADGIKAKTDQLTFTVANQVDCNAESWNAAAITTALETSADIADAVLDEALSGHVTAGTLGQAVADTETDVTAILADTNELQTDWVNGGRLDNILDARSSQTSVDTIDSNVDAILVDTADMQPKIGTPAGASVSADIATILSTGGTGPWTTGAGGSVPQLLQSTTIATLSTQTSFTLTDGSADDDAYNGAIVVVTDQSTATQKAYGTISDYVGSTKTVTLLADPAIFTMAAGDTIVVIAPLGAAGSAPSAAAIRSEIDANSTQLAAIVADTNELQTDDIPGLIAALDAVVDTKASQASVDTIDGIVDAILVDTGTTVPGLIAALNDPDTGAIATAVWNAATRTLSASTNLNDISTSDVLTQVNAALDTAISELGVGAPTATPTLRTGLMLLYMALRNKVDVTASAKEVHNNAGTVIASKSLSDDGTTYSEAEMS